MRLAALITVLVAFVAWSVSLLFSTGLGGITGAVQREPWALQFLVDLIIAATIGWSFMVPDARRRNLPFVPYLVATVVVGTPAMLAYLIHRELRAKDEKR